MTRTLLEIALAIVCFAAGYLTRRNNPHDPTIPPAK